MCDFVLGASDAEVTGRLKNLETRSVPLDRRFTQQEDFFLLLDRPYTVESFSIHHNVHDPEPPLEYLQVLRSVVQAWTDQVPDVFVGFSWFFDPKDLFHPLFVQVLSGKEKKYLLLLRPDLTLRGRYSEVLTKGGNATTARYSTRHLFLESEVVPIEVFETTEKQRTITLQKLFPFTWMGEEGRGYFTTGRWLDQELTKLLSRAALAPGVRSFPYCPLRCRYETLASRVVTPTPEGRRRAAAALDSALPLVAPWASQLQERLRDDPYRDDHPLLAELRQDWAGRLEKRWGDFRLEPYLNEQEQKEYRYHGI